MTGPDPDRPRALHRDGAGLEPARRGDKQYCAGLVAFNSIFQIALLPRLRLVLPHCSAAARWASRAAVVDVSFGQIAQSVLIYLGIPFVAGFLTRRPCRPGQGRRLVRGPVPAADRPDHAVALLFTIVAMFSLKGGIVPELPVMWCGSRSRSLLYFLIMFLVSFWMGEIVGQTIRARPPSLSPRPATTSSSPSPSLSPPLASLRRRLCRGHRPAGRGAGADIAGQRRLLAAPSLVSGRCGCGADSRLTLWDNKQEPDDSSAPLRTPARASAATVLHRERWGREDIRWPAPPRSPWLMRGSGCCWSAPTRRPTWMRCSVRRSPIPHGRSRTCQASRP